MALILEIRDSRGTPSWHRLDALPVTIGRALSNDIILDDPYLDARHARISMRADGRVEIEDLGTVNGLISAGARASAPLAAEAGREVRAGRTTLRFRDADEAVPAALRDQMITPRASGRAAETAEPPRIVEIPNDDTVLSGRLLASNRGRIAVCFAMLAAFGYSTWLSDTSRSSGSTVFTGVLGASALVGVWTVFWASVGRAVMHRFRFLTHATVASLAMIVMLAWSTLHEWLTFLFPDAKASWAVSMVVFLAVLAATISAHLALATAQPWKKQRRSGLLVAGGVVVLLILSAIVSDDKFTDVPKFANELKPMSARWVPAVSVSDFGATARDLRREVDADARKPAAP